jgi:hypothetical protein
VHFYSGTDALLLDRVQKNPFTRQPVASIHDWEPIVHPGTTSAAYLELIESLRRRGWSNTQRAVDDIAALRELDPQHDLARLDFADWWWRQQQPKPREYVGYRPRLR